MQLYQYEKIYSQMEREFGKIRKGEEETYAMLLKEQFHVDMLSQEQVKEYYKFPVMCLLRIKESIDTWEKRSGSDGYFDFIEGYMGREITGTEMNFSIMSSGIFDM